MACRSLQQMPKPQAVPKESVQRQSTHLESFRSVARSAPVQAKPVTGLASHSHESPSACLPRSECASCTRPAPSCAGLSPAARSLPCTAPTTAHPGSQGQGDGAKGVKPGHVCVGEDCKGKCHSSAANSRKRMSQCACRVAWGSGLVGKHLLQEDTIACLNCR